MLSTRCVLLFLCMGVGWAYASDVRLCNTQMPFAKDFIVDMYNKYPPTLNYDGQTYNIFGCFDFFRGRYVDTFWSDTEKSTCYGATASAKWSFMTGDFAGGVTAELIAIGICSAAVNRETNNCINALVDRYNQYHGLNFVFKPWPAAYGSAPLIYPGILTTGSVPSGTDAFGDFDIHVDQGAQQKNEYMPYNMGQGTLWTKLQLLQPAGSAGGPYQLNSKIFSDGITFDSKGIAGFSSEVSFSASLLQKGVVVKLGDTYGIYMKGCVPPVLYVRVTYESSSEYPNNDASNKLGGKQSPFSGSMEHDAILMAQEEENDAEYYYNYKDYHSPEEWATAKLGAMEWSDFYSRNANYQAPTSRRLLQFLQQQCYNRKVVIYDILPDTTAAMQCKYSVALGRLKYRLQSSLETAASTQKYLMDNTYYAQSSSAGPGFIAVSEGQAQRIVACATSASYWFGWSAEQPGMCMACAPLAKATNTEPVSCAASAMNVDCCYVCKAGFICFGCDSNGYYGDASLCKSPCPNYQAYQTSDNRCSNCAVGTVQNRTSGMECVPCSALSSANVNSIATSYGTCVACGTLHYAQGSQCQLCDTGKYVPMGTAACVGCPRGSVLSSDGAGSMGCVACEAGYYASGTLCMVCPANFYSGNSSVECLPCPSGFQSLDNRTGCSACPSFDAADLVQYNPEHGSGCDLQCVQTAYRKTSPYLKGGCLPCSSAMQPDGTYPSPTDCRRRLPCNTPPLNARFVGPGVDATSCPWQCKPSYYSAGTGASITCELCTQSTFNASKHVYLGDGTCAFTCQPTLHRTSNDKSTCEPCVDLYPDGAAQGLFSRVRQYKAVGAVGKSWETGSCGTNQTIPGSPIVFLLTRARYVWPSSTKACGNALLEAGEQCDDGNAVSGDGCDSTCQLELYLDYDCDVIGSKCLPRCGWATSDGSMSKLMKGLILPKRATCENISYYDYYYNLRGGSVDRLKWLHDTMVSCDCQAFNRQIPYSQCTEANRGCLACGTGYYYEDIGLPVCVECGSRCDAGFYTANVSKCGPSVSTAAMVSWDAASRNEAIGCVPCSSTIASDSVSWLYGCTYSCRPAAVLPSTSSKGYYCSNATLGPDGSCKGDCLQCACPGSSCEVPPNVGTGVYWAACRDGVGITAAACDRSTLPENAVFVGNGAYLQSRQCPWVCSNSSQWVASLGQCVSCQLLEKLSCAYDAVPVQCTSGLYYCLQCHASSTNRLSLQPFQVWRASFTGPYTSINNLPVCAPACAAGNFALCFFHFVVVASNP